MVFTINKIKYVTFEEVYTYKNIKCYIAMINTFS